MTVELQEWTKASELVALASSGEEVVLTRDGEIVGKFTAPLLPNPTQSEQGANHFGRLSPGGEVKYANSLEDVPRVTTEQAAKRFGFLKDKGYRVPDDIKTPFKKEIEEMFYGNPDKFK